MRKPPVCLGIVVAGLLAASPSTQAAPASVLKPYVVMILDTSGSMADSISGSLPTCGGTTSKLDNARCAINEIANSEGDIVFGLGRFRETMSGTTTAATFPSGCAMTGVTCASNCSITTGANCPADGSADDRFELLAPLVDGQNTVAASWTDFSGNTCTATGTNPEIWETAGSTPIAGALKGVKDYWQGTATVTDPTDGTVTIWPSTSPGFAPIANDPTNNAFLPASGCNASSTCDPSATCSGATCCCVSQCRPYVVIVLTDGQETCAPFVNGTLVAAKSLLTTQVGADNYRIITQAIGFGVAPPTIDCPVPSTGKGSCEIEDIAHAGGAPNVVGVNEGYYATDQASVELAITSILAGAIRTEVCNGLDDNCNGQIDEGFGVGNACDNGELGACKATGTEVCRADGTGTLCNAPSVAPGTEICNGIDDDCDGKVDEGLNCVGQCTAERCNGLDDDCDGKIDNNPDGTPLSRPCGQTIGACQAGVEICTNGMWGACSGTSGTPEVCNGIDDDCNGIVDGFSQACSNLPVVGTNPVGSPANNPGDPGQGTLCDAEGASVCACHPGNQSCPSNQTPPYRFGQCLGEVTPVAEVCNGLDDDCDGKIDEGTGGAACNAVCGVGVTVCVNGQLQCSATGAGTMEVCNGVDDDCDGKVDEGIPDGGPCNPPVPNNTYTVCNGTLQCVGGSTQCEGGTPVEQEQCNCMDDDCDGSVDEGANICGGNGAACVDCQCAFKCGGGEFPCPDGKTCNAAGYCVADLCENVMCPAQNGVARECKAGACVDTCSVTQCTGTDVCVPATGTCQPNNCSTFPALCTADQNCVAGVCVGNPCTGVNCNAPQYCESGTCVTSCAGITCTGTQECQLGVCVDNPCGRDCPAGEACNTASGMCISDPCAGVPCPSGEYCDSTDNGTCKTDPCVGTSCPDPSQICKAGTCYAPAQVSPDAGVDIVKVTTGGGGCDAGGGGADGGLLMALAGLVAARRRRREVRS